MGKTIKRKYSKGAGKRKYRGALAELYIRDYGVDGEKKISSNYNYDSPKKYNCKKPIRLICYECPEFKKCQGKKWKSNSCEPWQEFLRVTKPLLKKENKNV